MAISLTAGADNPMDRVHFFLHANSTEKLRGSQNSHMELKAYEVCCWACHVRCICAISGSDSGLWSPEWMSSLQACAQPANAAFYALCCEALSPALPQTSKAVGSQAHKLLIDAGTSLS